MPFAAILEPDTKGKMRAPIYMYQNTPHIMNQVENLAEAIQSKKKKKKNKTKTKTKHNYK